MSDIVIHIQSIGAYDNVSTNVFYTGIARCTGMTSDNASINWNVQVAPGALAATVNTAIRDAAITAVGDAGYTVGALDKKTLIGAAVGL